jgi:serine/threonine protein kinase/3-dehydroquinate dehydratase
MNITDYILSSKPLGKGAFAEVFLGTNKYDPTQLIAVKIIKYVEKYRKLIDRELEIHSKLHHPNIAELYSYIIDRKRNIVYMMMEYCVGGNLKDYQQTHSFTEIQLQTIMRQIVAALQYLYEHNILHRDLKPQNILLDMNKTVKLIDFGLAREFNEYDLVDTTMEINVFDTFCGSPLYMSPEMFRRTKYDTTTDLWSLGIILYELITGKTPYHSCNYAELYRKIMHPISLPTQYYSSLSADCIDLLTRLLQIDSVNRLKWAELFAHVWIAVDTELAHENSLLEHPLLFELLHLHKPIPKNGSFGQLTGLVQGVWRGCAPQFPLNPHDDAHVQGTAPQFPLDPHDDAHVQGKAPQFPLDPHYDTNVGGIEGHRPQFPHDPHDDDANVAEDAAGGDFAPPLPPTDAVQSVPIAESRMAQQQQQSTKKVQLMLGDSEGDSVLQHSFTASITKLLESALLQDYNIVLNPLSVSDCDGKDSETALAISAAVTTAVAEPMHIQHISSGHRREQMRRYEYSDDDGTTSMDFQFVKMQTDLKYVTPPDHTYTEGDTNKLAKFWHSSIRILKTSVRDTYDYLSSNIKSV